MQYAALPRLRWKTAAPDPTRPGGRGRLKAVEEIHVATRLHRLVMDCNENLRDAVVVVTIRSGLGGMLNVEAAAPGPGRRVVRLLYLWDEIEPYIGLPPERFLAEILQPLATEGGVLRARMRAVRR